MQQLRVVMQVSIDSTGVITALAGFRLEWREGLYQQAARGGSHASTDC